MLVLKSDAQPQGAMMPSQSASSIYYTTASHRISSTEGRANEETLVYECHGHLTQESKPSLGNTFTYDSADGQRSSMPTEEEETGR